MLLGTLLVVCSVYRTVVTTVRMGSDKVPQGASQIDAIDFQVFQKCILCRLFRLKSEAVCRQSGRRVSEERVLHCRGGQGKRGEIQRAGSAAPQVRTNVFCKKPPRGAHVQVIRLSCYLDVLLVKRSTCSSCVCQRCLHSLAYQK